MPRPQLVDPLVSPKAQPLGDLLGPHQLIDVDLPAHWASVGRRIGPLRSIVRTGTLPRRQCAPFE